MHSPKGTTWKNHKYIKIVNGRHIYDRESLHEDTEKLVAERRDEVTKSKQRKPYFTQRSNAELGKAITDAQGTSEYVLNAAIQSVIAQSKAYDQMYATERASYSTAEALNIGTRMIDNAFKNGPVVMPKKGLGAIKEKFVFSINDLVSKMEIKKKPLKVTDNVNGKKSTYYLLNGKVVDKNGKPIKK